MYVQEFAVVTGNSKRNFEDFFLVGTVLFSLSLYLTVPCHASSCWWGQLMRSETQPTSGLAPKKLDVGITLRVTDIVLSCIV
jgi:hypothetical protein